MISEKQKAYKSLSAESKKYDHIFHIIKNLLLIFSLLLYIFITIAQTVHLYAPQLPVEGKDIILQEQSQHHWQILENHIPTNQNQHIQDQPDSNVEIVFHGESHEEIKEKSPEVTKQGQQMLFSLKFSLQKPSNYYNISAIKEIRELPICIISINKRDIVESIKSQAYKNYHIVTIQNKAVDYYEIKKTLQKSCNSKELVYIVESELKPNSLTELNTFFQTQKVWAVYIKTKVYIKVVAFYRQVYFRVQSNDFQNHNKNNIQKYPQICTALSIIDLTRYYIDEINAHLIFNKIDEEKVDGFINVIPAISQLKNLRNSMYDYQSLFTLSQTYPIKQAQILNQKDKAERGKILRQTYENFIKTDKIKRFLENVEMKNLPTNHSIFEREKKYLYETYKLNQYPLQIPFCVVVLSNNNIQHDRYKKVLDTIKHQQYDNYHVVFIDDVSTDATYEATIEYSKKIGIPDSKIKFLKNKERRYATYNLRNAAFNYCEQTDVFMIVDGDDELVGRQVFRLISSFYQKKKNWIVYTNYFTSDYQIGSSYKIPLKYKERTQLYRSKPRHLVGPVRTFFTALFRKIKDKDHKFDDGTYLTTMYDDAMQEPMLEMSGHNVEYIPQLCYLYNRNTGNNDNSTPEKKELKKKVYEIILKRKTYERISLILTKGEQEEWQNRMIKSSYKSDK